MTFITSKVPRKQVGGGGGGGGGPRAPQCLLRFQPSSPPVAEEFSNATDLELQGFFPAVGGQKLLG